INEYVFAIDEAEWSRANALREDLVAGLGTETPVPALWVVAVAAYWPLSAVPSSQRLMEQSWPDSVRGLLTQQVTEPLEERRYRGKLRTLTAVSAGITQAVRQQYEENPYPRWLKVPPAPEATSVDDFLHQQLPGAHFDALGKGREFDILVAGCGTGIEAVMTAQRFPRSRVLAVDLSVSSLCYA